MCHQRKEYFKTLGRLKLMHKRLIDKPKHVRIKIIDQNHS